jgi:succinate dehydrogenase / fumarate reductase cytochrome b subunit
MAVSILHRITGNGLALAGLGLLLWWVGAIAGGEGSYQTFVTWVWSGNGPAASFWTAILGKVVLIGLTWAFFQHLATGLRHFVLDIGAGYELHANARWSLLTVVFSLAATTLFWVFVHTAR